MQQPGSSPFNDLWHLLMWCMQGQRACISLKALAEAFPSRPPAMIRTYLKDTCDLAVRVSPASAGRK